MSPNIVRHIVNLVANDIQNLYDDPFGYGDEPEIKEHHKLLEATCKELDIDINEIVTREASPYEITRMTEILHTVS